MPICHISSTHCSFICCWIANAIYAEAEPSPTDALLVVFIALIAKNDRLAWCTDIK
jgi:hypothetical protein